MSNEDLQQIQTLVTNSRKVLILTRKSPTLDTMAAALALYLSLIKLGKEATVVTEEPVTVALSNLVGIDKVQTSITGKNLMITYRPYTLGNFEKVTCVETPGQAGSEDRFTLTVFAKDGVIPDPKNFNFSFSGGAADLVITVDVLEPTMLGGLYDADLFTTAPVINFDNHDPNKDYGKFNLVEPEAASICEIVTFFLRAVNVQIDEDIARNLYDGIIMATNNFQSPKVTAAAFEAAAICLRAGARKPAAPAPVASGVTVQTNGSVPTDWTQPKIYRGTSTV